MRYIEDLRDIYKDKEIWIIGCGSSLDDFPDRFFKGKITIALNWAIIRFPDCTYWHGHHEEFREYLRDEKPEFLEKSIILFPFPGPFLHGRITDPKEFFGDLVSKPIWMKFWDTRPIPRTAFEEVIKAIMEKRMPRGYRASMSVAHTAVEAAAIMGANRITMVGCENRPGPYAKDGGIGAYCPCLFEFDPSHRIENGTKWLTELFRSYGIKIRRYFYRKTKNYPRGYQKIK